MNLPTAVSAEEGQAALDVLRDEEAEATRASDALAAQRRRLPHIEKDYVFDGTDGKATRLDLFKQTIVELSRITFADSP